MRSAHWKKKCTCVPLCSAIVSNISQRGKLNPSFSSQFTCLKKQTFGGFVAIYTPRLRNEIISLILWYIFIAFRQIQLVWSLIIKLWCLYADEPGWKLHWNIQRIYFSQTGYFPIEDFVSPTWYMILYYSNKAINISRLNWFSFTVIWFVFLSVFFFVNHLQRLFIAPQIQTTLCPFLIIWNTMFSRICFSTATAIDRNFSFLRPEFQRFLTCFGENSNEVNKKCRQETMVVAYLKEQQEKRRKSEKCWSCPEENQ